MGRKTTTQSVNQAPCSTRSSVTADGPCKRAVAVKCPVHTARQIRQDSAVSVVSGVAKWIGQFLSTVQTSNFLSHTVLSCRNAIQADATQTRQFCPVWPGCVNEVKILSTAAQLYTVSCFAKTRKPQMWKLEALCKFSVQKLLILASVCCKLFENFVGVQFLNRSVERRCTANPQQIKVVELEGYSWPMCSKQPRLVDKVSATRSTFDEFCWQRNRLAVAKFSKPRVWDSVLEGSTLISGGTRFFCVGQVEGSLRGKSQLDPSSGFDTIPTCDGWTDGQTNGQADGHTTTAYTALA